MTVKRAVAEANESSPDRRNVGVDSIGGDKSVLEKEHDRGFYGKLKAVGGEIEADQESTGSSEDIESPRSVVAKARRWSATATVNKNFVNKNLNLYVHSQILRIREEESHIGEDVAENLSTGAADERNDCGYRNVDMLIYSQKPIRPASPLSGKTIKSVGH